jgi:hypothetical protein
MKARRTCEANATERTYGPFLGRPRAIAKADGPRACGYRSIALAAYRVFLFSSSTKAVPYFGASEVTIFSKRRLPRDGSQPTSPCGSARD